MRWQIACLTLALAGIAWTAVGEETSTTECRPELLAPVNVLDADMASPCCRQAIEDRYECQAAEPTSVSSRRLFSKLDSVETSTDEQEYALLPAVTFTDEPMSDEAKLEMGRRFAVEPPAEENKRPWKNALLNAQRVGMSFISSSFGPIPR